MFNGQEENGRKAVLAKMQSGAAKSAYEIPDKFTFPPTYHPLLSPFSRLTV